MKLDDSEKCAGTLQPGRGAVLGLCLGCSRYTLGRASMAGIAHIEKNPPFTDVWACSERRSMGLIHVKDGEANPRECAPLDIGGTPRGVPYTGEVMT